MKIRKTIVLFALALFIMQGAIGQDVQQRPEKALDKINLEEVDKKKDEGVMFRSDLLEKIQNADDASSTFKYRMLLRQEDMAKEQGIQSKGSKEKQDTDFEYKHLVTFDAESSGDKEERKKTDKKPFFESDKYKRALANSDYKCGKMLDTIINHEWNGSSWVMSDRHIWKYNDNGDVTSFLRENYETTGESDPYWEPAYRITYTFDNGNETEELHEIYDVDKEEWFYEERFVMDYSNGNLVKRTHQERDTSAGEWNNDEQFQYDYDDNGMTMQMKQYWNDGAEEWDLGWRDIYQFNADGYMTEYGKQVVDNDGNYHTERHWKIDPEAWPVDWEFDHEDFFYDYIGFTSIDLVDLVFTEAWGKYTFNPTDGTFDHGVKYERELIEIDEYYYEDDIEYGDLIGEMAKYYWNPDDEEWDGVEKNHSIEYSPYGDETFYVYAEYKDNAWNDTIQWTYEYDEYQLPKMEQKEISTSEGWKIVNKTEWYDYSWGEKLLELSKTWDTDNQEFSAGSKVENKWDYDIDSDNPYMQQTYTWDADEQAWVDDYYMDKFNGLVYTGNGNFEQSSSKYSFFIEKQYDQANEVWDTLSYVTTEYNEEDYPLERIEYSGGTDAKEDREVLAYTDNGDISDYTHYGSYESGEWVESEKETFTYNEDNNPTEYVYQYHDGSDWVNDLRTLWSYETPSKADLYIDESDTTTLATFMYSSREQVYNTAENEWVNQSIAYWGADWDIWATYDTDAEEWVFTEWWFAQDFTWADYVPWLIPSEDYGLKTFNTDESRWMYQEYYIYDYEVVCGYLLQTDYLEALGSDDGRELVNQLKYDATWDCLNETPTLLSYNQYDWSGEWVQTLKENHWYSENDDGTYSEDSAAVYQNIDGEFVRTGGFDTYEEYDENGNLIEEWEKDYSSFPDINGYRYLYSYTEDGYLTEYIEQEPSNSGNWVNDYKEVSHWSGEAGLDIAGEATDVLCHGDETGAIEIAVSGGTEPYDYEWSNGDTTKNLTGVPAGVYQGTVTDANGCSFTGPKVEITQPQDPIEASLADENASDDYTPDGKAWIESVSGGTPAETAPHYLKQWDDPMQTVGDTVTGIKGGEYTVTITDDAGCVLTKTIQVNPDEITGVRGLLENQQIALYPNPVQDMVNVEFRESLNGGTLNIYTTSGELLHTEKLSDTKTTINLSDYESGVYIIKVKSGENTVNQRIMVE